MPNPYKFDRFGNIIRVLDNMFLGQDPRNADYAKYLSDGGAAVTDPADPLPPLPPDLQDMSLAQLDTDMAAAANLADAKAALRKFAQAFRQARKS